MDQKAAGNLKMKLIHSPLPTPLPPPLLPPLSPPPSLSLTCSTVECTVFDGKLGEGQKAN